MSEQKKRTLMPKLRFPEFREAGEWEECELGPLTTKVGSGITPTGGDKNYKTEGRPFVRSQNVGWGELILNDVAFIDEETHQSFSSTEIKVSDVLLNITGASIGRSVVADSRIAGGNVNQHVCIIRIKRDKLNPAMLNNFLVSERGQKQIDSFQTGGNRQGLNFAQIRSFKIPLPPTESEQRRIANCLASLDELITLEAQKLDTFKTHKKGLMQQLFPAEGETLPKLRFPEFRDAGGWEVKPLGKMCDVLNNRRKPITSSDRVSGPYPYYGASGIVDYVNDFIFDERLLLIGEDGAKWGAYEKTAFIVEGKYWVNNHAHVLKPFGAKDTLLENYLTMLDLGPFITGAAPPKLTLGKLKEVPVPVPSCISEQQKIASCLTSLDDLITAQTQKLAALKTHKKGLMQQLFPSVGGVAGEA